MSPNKTSIAHRILQEGIGSVSDKAATAIAARLEGKRPPINAITEAIKAAVAAGEVEVVRIGSYLTIQ